ncbi:NADPH-dependent assimilatory sulfite reductase flavoprotein subunit [Pantoea sp. Mhis]|uniref:NADPH-dependent assimilatory sulfite reductase flavoprotein subunit n=1 Tax=Pantoea sp. Mhis TaxID=2576759 RepID=UPI00135C89C7|nr:NADPH-dependent assimilatory sulfite reductase flavoprotein subunit [Pantoea sp. Mhis]MXP56720.1 NADPH-dependent assimilatory sulfite reductase flavoprotein subunit [Pantoea sp. Mhis]
MTTPLSENLLFPFKSEQLIQLQEIISDLDTNQLIWLSGYFWGIAIKQNSNSVTKTEIVSSESPVITLISSSQTGNARRLAEQLNNELIEAKLNVNLINAGNYNFKKIDQEKLLIIITSTYGEGEPPEEALALYKFLMSEKAPKCQKISFAIFGLGDHSYEFFSQTAKDFDRRLAELGGERLLKRVDADIDYHEQAQIWRQEIIQILKTKILVHSSVQSSLTNNNIISNIKNNHNVKEQFTKENPLTAKVLINQKITGHNSDKDIRHIEIDISNTNLYYQPGDALGVWYENDLDLVQELISLVGLKDNQLINVGGENLSLLDALQKHFELTVNTPQIVKKYAMISKSKFLLELVNNTSKLQEYIKCLPIIDMIRQNTINLNTEQLISFLRPLTPRLYSISSSQMENKTEVHITVGVVRYKINGYIRGGGASTWLAKTKENSEIRIFVEKNHNFRLPDDIHSPIIMIAAGTGIAPFRAFMQERNMNNVKSQNWLFFGNPYFTEDFLYQVEWQKYVKDNVLTNIDLAWSRDQKEKIYVQDKIREKSSELWYWIKKGAYLYVCGDANRMAKNVEQALLDVISTCGNMDYDTADVFLSNLRLERRYQRDIY